MCAEMACLVLRKQWKNLQNHEGGA
jgi:hypothetical protein